MNSFLRNSKGYHLNSVLFNVYLTSTYERKRFLWITLVHTLLGTCWENHDIYRVFWFFILRVSMKIWQNSRLLIQFNWSYQASWKDHCYFFLTDQFSTTHFFHNWLHEFYMFWIWYHSTLFSVSLIVIINPS